MLAAHVQYHGMVTEMPENRQYFCQYVKHLTRTRSTIILNVCGWLCRLTRADDFVCVHGGNEGGKPDPSTKFDDRLSSNLMSQVDYQV